MRLKLLRSWARDYVANERADSSKNERKEGGGGEMRAVRRAQLDLAERSALEKIGFALSTAVGGFISLYINF